jgi:hypothetical protein
MTPRRRKPERMDCNSARSLNDKHCGPQARYFAARRYPHWLWPVGSILAGSLAIATCFLLLMLLVSHVFPAQARFTARHGDQSVFLQTSTLGAPPTGD